MPNNRPFRKRLTSWIASVLFLAGIVWALLRFGERWLRLALLYLSDAEWANDLVTNFPLARRMSRRFVAGETLEEAMAATRTLNSRGMSVTLDYLGEKVTKESLAVESRNEIVRILERIEKSGVNANVSVKLTQLGIQIREELAAANLRLILRQAESTGNWIRIDMEESELVDATLELYRQLRDQGGFDNVGVVIQSYLYRSEEDVRQLVDEGARVRLCKGAYAEPPDIAFPEKSDTDANYIRLAHLLMSNAALDNGVHTALATHDEKIIEKLLGFIKSENVSPDRYEFQMLYGIRRDLQESLVDQGHSVRIYVPYGTAWYPYFARRLAERPANLWFLLSNLLQ